MFSDKQSMTMNIEFDFSQPKESACYPYPSAVEIETFLRQFRSLYSLVCAVDWYSRESENGRFSESMQSFVKEKDFAGVWECTKKKFSKGCESGMLSKQVLSHHMKMEGNKLLIKSITHKNPTILEVVVTDPHCVDLVVRAIFLLIEFCRGVGADGYVRVRDGNGKIFEHRWCTGTRYRRFPHPLRFLSNCIRRLLYYFRRFYRE